jgi:SAM-dependent methyltransferase
MVHWLERLVEKGALKPGQSMLEFGPQDVDVPRAMVCAIASRILGESEAQRRVSAAYEGDGFRRTHQADFYSIFGITKYDSLDPFDERSKYQYDLGAKVPIFKKFDVITNFGTAEHVFNINNVFKTAYDLLPVGGVLLNVNPAHGDIDHGFYNLHPTLFRTLAAHSGFEIVDLQFIDDIAARTEVQRRNPSGVFNFDDLPIKYADMSDENRFKYLVYDRFISNATDKSRPELWAGARPPMVFDYNFVALRKTSSRRFVAPYQYTQTPPHRLFNAHRWMTGARSVSWYKSRFIEWVHPIARYMPAPIQRLGRLVLGMGRQL